MKDKSARVSLDMKLTNKRNGLQVILFIGWELGQRLVLPFSLDVWALKPIGHLLDSYYSHTSIRLNVAKVIKLATYYIY